MFIDSTIVKAHRAEALKKREVLGEYIGNSRGCQPVKVRAVVNAQGRPLRMTIKDGQVHDAKAAGDVLDWPDDPLAFVADKAYNSKHIRQAITDHGTLAVIPAKSNARNTKSSIERRLKAFRDI